MEDGLRIRLLEDQDVKPIVSAFREIGWRAKTAAQYERYLAEQNEGSRTVLVATVSDVFAGYLTVQWRSAYRPFEQQHVPEITDLNVLPRFRRLGIGGDLMDEAERRISERSPVAGIGVGMDADYGTAQRMYALRGYVPNGLGLTRDGHHVRHGEQVTVDDGLALYLTKRLAGDQSGE